MAPKTADGPKLMPETEDLARDANFAAVTTLLPSGQPQTQVLWVHAEDGSCAEHRETPREVPQCRA